MNLTESFDISPEKVAALLARIAALRIDPAAIDEQFVRGGGPGGQKINKTLQLRRAALSDAGPGGALSAGTGGGTSTASWR